MPRHHVSAPQDSQQGQQAASLLERRREQTCGGRRWKHVLHLGEINDSQELAWRRSIEVLDEAADQPKTLSLFPEDRAEDLLPTIHRIRSAYASHGRCARDVRPRSRARRRHCRRRWPRSDVRRPPPERPRSSSMNSTMDQPSVRARSARPYWRRRLSWLCKNWLAVDWRM